MTKAICIEPIGIEGGETYHSGIEYEVSAKILKEYAFAFKEVKTAAKKDASKVTENK